MQKGTQWREDTLLAQFPNSLQELNITADVTYADTPVPTAYEPINHGIADQSLWIDSFLYHVGDNTASSSFTDLDKWNHDQRLANGADWALTAFVVERCARTGVARCLGRAGRRIPVRLAVRRRPPVYGVRFVQQLRCPDVSVRPDLF